MSIEAGIGIELDLGSKHDGGMTHMPPPSPKPVRKPLGVALTTSGAPLPVTIMVIDGVPANGRVWEIIQLGVFGSDAHTDLVQAVGNPVTLAATTVASYNNNAYPVNVSVTGGTVTVIAVNGTVTGLTSGTFFVPAGGTLTITYTVAPALASSGVVGPSGVAASPLNGVVCDVFAGQSTDPNLIDFSTAKISGMTVGSIYNIGHKKIWVKSQEQVYALVYGAPANQNLSFVIFVDEWKLSDVSAMSA
jgi:hypothetical protein